MRYYTMKYEYDIFLLGRCYALLPNDIFLLNRCYALLRYDIFLLGRCYVLLHKQTYVSNLDWFVKNSVNSNC